MKNRRARCLKYLGSERRTQGIRHFYDIDGRPLSFFTSVAQVGLSDQSLNVAAAQSAMANLVDIHSITLPHEVIIEGITLNRDALDFWQRTSRLLAAERLVEENLPASILDARWRSRSAVRGRMDRLPKATFRRKLLAMSGGKESLTALKLMPDTSAFSMFFLQYPDKGWQHGKRLFNFFQQTHNCLKIRNDITGTGPLTQQFHCSRYGMFVIGQIVFNSLLLMDQFSGIIIGNEFSANFENCMHQGISVNHQYDKSFVFAKELNDYLSNHVTDEFSHTSPFWKWYEYRIGERFFSDDLYLDQWTSCNNSQGSKLFCGDCAKCAFVFLMGAAHTNPMKIRRIMGANMLNNLELIISLADPESRKPLECVGTKEEVWVALEDIFGKHIWRKSPGLKYYSERIRPSILARIPNMRKKLMRTQSLQPFSEKPHKEP